MTKALGQHVRRARYVTIYARRQLVKMALNVFRIIKEGTKAVPATKFAVGIAGMVAIVALIVSLKIDLRVALWGTIILLGLMVLLVIFSKLTKTAAEEFKLPVKFFMWAFVILFISISFMLTTSVFFRFPVDLQFFLVKIDTAPTPHLTKADQKDTDGILLRKPERNLDEIVKLDQPDQQINQQLLASASISQKEPKKNTLRKKQESLGEKENVKEPDRPTGKQLNGLSGLNGMFYDYTGDVVRNLPNGTGVAIYTNKLKLQGTFKDGHLFGRGKINYTNGDKYEGECANDQANGYGFYIRADSARAEGYFANDKWNGQFFVTYRDGTTYKGDIINNFWEGYGVVHFRNGNVYTGYFKNGWFSGKGKMIFGKESPNDGDTYEGDFYNGDFNGIGTYNTNIKYRDRCIRNCSQAIRYTGSYSAGKKQGLGRCYNNDGEILYEGKFIDDKPVEGYGR